MASDTVHYYYGDPKWLNLDKIREEAYDISHDSRMGPPRTVIIHHHKQSESCASMSGEPAVKHETYLAKEV